MNTLTEKAVLSDQDTLKEVIDCLTEHLTIKTQGACNQTDLFNILVAAASKADTIENTASSLKKSSSPKNIRYHLAKFKSFLELESQLNLALINRLKNICRIRTTTKNPIIRLLFVGIAFVLLNIWIDILWAKISKPRRGGRLIYRKLFNLKQMLAFLANAINRIYEVREIVDIPEG